MPRGANDASATKNEDTTAVVVSSSSSSSAAALLSYPADTSGNGSISLSVRSAGPRRQNGLSLPQLTAEFGRGPTANSYYNDYYDDPKRTIRERRKCEMMHHSRLRESAVSRASMVNGTNPNGGELWYDAEAFLLDQVREVLNKLQEGSIDDEIWGKIVIMERCKRVAKAYLRKTTVIVDGSEEEFDGKTLGFNAFDNSSRDEHTEEIRTKIGDGVILKMDYQGNIKGMARGTAPVICQGWKDTRNNSISDRLVRLQGKLNATNDEEKAYKMFDMRRFKHALERELHEDTPNARTLLLKTCVRVALVKDGSDMLRTPCWFAVVNLVALDMLKEKIPSITTSIAGQANFAQSRETIAASSVSLVPPVQNENIQTQAITQILAAAVNQMSKGGYANTAAPLQGLQISPEQLAQIANSLNITNAPPPSRMDLTTMNKKERVRRPYHRSSSSDSSGEDSGHIRSEVDNNKNQRNKRWEQSTRSMDALYDSGMEKSMEKEKKKPQRSGLVAAYRPRLADVMFTRSHSITSDYDSNREHFDSGSWSSTNSRGYKGGRSTSSSVTSEPELAALAKKEPRTVHVPEEEDEEEEEPIYRTPIEPENANATEVRIVTPEPSITYAVPPSICDIPPPVVRNYHSRLNMTTSSGHYSMETPILPRDDEMLTTRDSQILRERENAIRSRDDEISTRNDQISSKMDQIPTRNDQNMTRMDQISSRMDQNVTRMDQNVTRMDQVPTRMDQIPTRIDQIPPHGTRFDARPISSAMSTIGRSFFARPSSPPPPPPPPPPPLPSTPEPRLVEMRNSDASEVLLAALNGSIITRRVESTIHQRNREAMEVGHSRPGTTPIPTSATGRAVLDSSTTNTGRAVPEEQYQSRTICPGSPMPSSKNNLNNQNSSCASRPPSQQRSASSKSSKPPSSKRPSFVSELRQVLQQRTSAVRLGRNKSQPSSQPPSSRRPAAGDVPVRGTTFYGGAPPRGLRRTQQLERPPLHLPPQQQFLHQQQQQLQAVASAQYHRSATGQRIPPQHAFVPLQSLTPRIGRTASMPWAHHPWDPRRPM